MTRVFSLARALGAAGLWSLCLLTTGCGSIHVGTETHTHVFGSTIAQSDDVQAGQIKQCLQILRQMQNSDAKLEPLEGFLWTDAGIPEEDLTDEQYRRIGGSGQ